MTTDLISPDLKTVPRRLKLSRMLDTLPECLGAHAMIAGRLDMRIARPRPRRGRSAAASSQRRHSHVGRRAPLRRSSDHDLDHDLAPGGGM